MGGGRPSICVPAAKIRRSVWVMRVTPPAPSVCHEPSCPDGARALVETDQRRAGRRPLERAFDPPLPEGVEVRQHRDPRNEVQRIPVAPLAVPRHPLADQRPSAHRHRAGRRATERRTIPPRRRRSRPTTASLGGSSGRDPGRRPRGRRTSPPALGPRRPDRGRVPPLSPEAPRPRDRGPGTIVARSGRHARRPVGRRPSRGRTRRRRPQPSPRHGRSARCPG